MYKFYVFIYYAEGNLCQKNVKKSSKDRVEIIPQETHTRNMFITLLLLI
jgi:hypothetical protein